MPPPRSAVVTGDRERLLRREVGLLRRRETRRVFDTAVHVGVLGGDSAGFVARGQDLPVLDAALRTDVVSGLLDTAPAGGDTVWLVRAGTPEPHDLDRQWLAAALLAFGMHGRRLEGCYVLTRTGWRDVGTDEQRTWVRLRL